MATTQLSLLGLIPVELFQPVCERLTAASHSGEWFTRQTHIYHRGAVPVVDNGMVPDENALYLRQLRTASHQQPSWTMQVLLKPEPLRQSPNVLAQPCTEVPLATDDGADPHRVVSALGYKFGTSTFARGVRFHRSGVLIELSQYFTSADSTSPLDSSYFVAVSTQFLNPRTAQPTPAGKAGTPSGAQAQGAGGATADELKAEGMGRLNEVKAVLRGLCDLARVDP